MKKILSMMAAAALLTGMTLAQGHGGHGKPAGAGKPATTGVEHAESTASSKGVDNGIENAEAKQGAHKSKKGKSGAAKSHKHSKSTAAAPTTK